MGVTKKLQAVIISGQSDPITVTNDANGTPGSPTPSEATLIGGEDPSGDLQAIAVDNTGNLLVSLTETARSYSASFIHDYASVNVSTIAWTELTASTTQAITHMYIFDSSGQLLELGVGAAGLEDRVFLIQPGGPSGRVDLTVPSGSRVAIKAITATANVGFLAITGIA